MHTVKNIILVSLLAAGLGTAGWAYYRGQVRQQATLQQFTQLDLRLAADNRVAGQQAKMSIEGIILTVNQNRLQPRDMIILHTAEKISSRTKSLVDTLQALRRQFSGGETANSLNISTSVTVAPTTSTALAAHIKGYVAFIQQFTPDVPPPTQPYGDDLLSNETVEIPLAAALATCTRLETQIRRYGEEALMSQAMKVGTGCCLCFDRIGLWAVAESKTVAPGAIYRSQLFLTQSSSNGLYRKASVNGKPVQLLYPGHAKAEFRTAPASPAQPDTVRAHWQGVIWGKRYPADTAWQLSVPYFIVRPRVQ